MDIVSSLFVIVFIYPWLFPLVMLLIRLDSRGPVFFRQQRVGFLGRTFWCYKFRTMYVNNCADTRRASSDDPRVTRVGRFLRNTCLDEFPQFMNVLLGHMSIVGPRPHMLHDSREFASLIDNYRFRDMVRPGITGLSQVRGYRGPAASFESILRRYQWDSFYVRNVGFRLDLRIMFETCLLILQSLVHRNRPIPADNRTIDRSALAAPNKKIA
jgi:putative colanic acid biosynthesis UDP-glucose lipid carrier transferase